MNIGKLTVNNEAGFALVANQVQSGWQVLDLSADAATHAVLLATGANVVCPGWADNADFGWDKESDHLFDLIVVNAPPLEPDQLSRLVPLLKPGGKLLLTMILVPGSRLRGKKARLHRQAGKYIKTMLRFHDRANGRCYSLDRWEDALMADGFVIDQQSIHALPVDFASWSGHLSPTDRLRLRVMVTQAPTAVADFLTPQTVGDRIEFRLQQIVIWSSRQTDGMT